MEADDHHGAERPRDAPRGNEDADAATAAERTRARAGRSSGLTLDALDDLDGVRVAARPGVQARDPARPWQA